VAGPDKPSEPGDAQKSVCLLLEAAARANGLPVEFFARVIWQESRFRSDAVGPVTRSGKRALGIAQFMPGTAAERKLLNPLDPIQALPKSAEFLHELRGEFGNLGLAAAAYNAGPRRIREWINPVEQWSKAGPDADLKQEPELGCGELMALLRRAPNRFVAALEQRIVAGVMQPWGAILGADMSRPRMLSKYAELQQRHPAVLAGRDPILLERRRGPLPRYQGPMAVWSVGDSSKACRRRSLRAASSGR
jgi:hypothetical protein